MRGLSVKAVQDRTAYSGCSPSTPLPNKRQFPMALLRLEASQNKVQFLWML